MLGLGKDEHRPRMKMREFDQGSSLPTRMSGMANHQGFLRNFLRWMRINKGVSLLMGMSSKEELPETRVEQ
jgi:hypothetical protein